jgi:type I restriction enzyme, S subunit
LSAEQENWPGWVYTTLGDVLRLNYGKSLPAKKRDGRGFPVFGSNGQVGLHSEALIQGPALIVGRKGSIGEVHHSSGPCSPIDTTYYIDDFGPQPPLFWLYQLRHMKLNELNRSSAIPGLNREDAYMQSAVVPPLSEQRRIVAKIEVLQARSQSARDALEAVPPLLVKFRQSVLAAAFRGDLTADWREQNPDAAPASSLVAEPPPKPSRFKSRSKSIQTGDYALAVGNPERPSPAGWEWTLLADVARLETGHTPSRKHPEYWGGEVPWISIPDAREHHTQTIPDTSLHTNGLGLANSAARLLPKDTVCMSRTASIGYVTVMGQPMATSQDFVDWVCTPAIDPHWLKWLLVAEKQALLRFGKGSTHKTIYFHEVLSFNACLPPREEQDLIVERIGERFALAAQLQNTVEACSQQHVGIAPAILAKAFRGELVDQDENDEPASELLERTRHQEFKEARPIKPTADRAASNEAIRVMKKKAENIPVKEALAKAGKKLSGQNLLLKAGYPQDASTDALEKFFLDIRSELDVGAIVRERSEDGTEDWFQLA